MARQSVAVKINSLHDKNRLFCYSLIEAMDKHKLEARNYLDNPASSEVYTRVDNEKQGFGVFEFYKELGARFDFYVFEDATFPRLRSELQPPKRELFVDMLAQASNNFTEYKVPQVFYIRGPEDTTKMLIRYAIEIFESVADLKEMSNISERDSSTIKFDNGSMITVNADTVVMGVTIQELLLLNPPVY